MERIETDLPGVVLLQPTVHEDERGLFMETYSLAAFEKLGIQVRFVQDNFVVSKSNVLRGLHYQLVRPQAKLIRVAFGEIFDVAIDIRKGSSSFGRWTGVVLSGDNRSMLYVPEGFAHGYYVMSDSASVEYKCSNYYCRDGERGIAWDDPEIGIEWPLCEQQPVVSSKDRNLGRLSETGDADLPAMEAAG